MLGVPESLIDRGGFSFGETEAATPEEKTNPWLLLRKSGDTVPAFVEENTAIWQLKKGLGDIVEVQDEEGRPVKLRIAGMLKDSVFQSELLIGDAAFRRSFPRTEGFSYFLIDVSLERDPTLVQRTFEQNLGVYGMEVTRTTDRVAAYLAVQNTYLSTFQLLGGFGLLLGVLGLAVVLLRNVWERRSELALCGRWAIALARSIAWCSSKTRCFCCSVSVSAWWPHSLRWRRMSPAAARFRGSVGAHARRGRARRTRRCLRCGDGFGADPDCRWVAARVIACNDIPVHSGQARKAISTIRCN